MPARRTACARRARTKSTRTCWRFLRSKRRRRRPEAGTPAQETSMLLLRVSPPEDHPPGNLEPDDADIQPDVGEGKHHDKAEQMHRMPPEQRGGNDCHE